MNTKFIYKGKKITKKAAVELFGAKELEKRIQETIEYFYEEAGCDNSLNWMDGLEIIVG